METKNSTADLLDRMYKNVKMGSDSIINLMPKVSDEALRTEMTKELSELENYSARIGDMLHSEGRKPKEENIVTKTSTVTVRTQIFVSERSLRGCFVEVMKYISSVTRKSIVITGSNLRQHIK